MFGERRQNLHSFDAQLRGFCGVFGKLWMAGLRKKLQSAILCWRLGRRVLPVPLLRRVAGEIH